MIAVIELRCRRHKHGDLIGDVVIVKCHQCSQQEGHPVYHRFDKTSGVEQLNGLDDSQNKQHNSNRTANDGLRDEDLQCEKKDIPEWQH